MIHLIVKFIMLAELLGSVTEVVAWPDEEIKSREYKVMLKNSTFNGSSSTVLTKLGQLRTALANIATSSSVGAAVNGNFALANGMPRTVKYYDTSNCLLNSNGWSFRMRRDSGETDWEGTLKIRTGDRYYSDLRRKKMNECCNSCTDLGGKFEEDIKVNFTSNKYSYSHKCEVSDSKNINNLDDIEDHWIEIDEVWSTEFGWNMNTAISKVNNLEITEKKYRGFEVDFDTSDDPNKDDDEVGEFDVTLWYTSSTSTTPALVELSFTLESLSSSLEDWNEETIKKSHFFWKKCGTNLNSWIDVNSPFKTQWVYDYWGMGSC